MTRRRPVVLRLPDGREVGVPGLREANHLYPGSTILRHQDGTKYTGKQPKRLPRDEGSDEGGGDEENAATGDEE